MTMRPAWFWWMLALGVALRLATVGQPCFNNSNLRQTQTAVVTQSMITGGGFALEGAVSWMGDQEARLLLELPLYNWLVAALHAVIGHLDVCGKLVTVGFWALSFWLLQFLWRRLLDVEETFWANFLFLFAPLSLFFGQAFQPEMLILAAGLGLLVLLWKYLENPTLAWFLGLAATGLIGLLLKAPEILHLYLVIVVMIGAREGVAAVRRPRYWVALLATAAILRLWSRQIDRVNAAHFGEWTSAKVVEFMIGPWLEHVHPVGYLRLLVYLTLFCGAVSGMVWVLWGLKEMWQRRRNLFIIAWLGSLVFFYVFWAGAAARVHSYYHLPALGPVCLLFGLGAVRCLKTERALRRPLAARLGLALVVLAGAAGPCAFLYQQDRVLMAACDWLRRHTAPEDLVLVRVNHRTDTSTYRHNSTVAYYGQRRIWCWVPDLPEPDRQRALRTSRWALVTHPPTKVEPVERWRRWVKQMPLPVEDMSWLETKGFAKHFQGDGFTVYKRTP